MIAAEAEMEEQNNHEQRTNGFPDPGVGDYPMTDGHLEIQAVNEAVREISNAILILKDIVNDLPPQFSDDHQTLLQNNLDFVSGRIVRVPDRLTSLLVQRKAELDAVKKARYAAAETLGAAQERMAAAESKEIELVADAEAFEGNKKMADEKMHEVADLLRAVEMREKLVARRERKVGNLEEQEKFERILNLGADATMEYETEALAAKASEGDSSTSSSEILTIAVEKLRVGDRRCAVVKSEEEQVIEDLNLGADAALEDAADAAEAEAREIERLTSMSKRLNPAVENGETHARLDDRSNTHSASERVSLRQDALAGKEERLWHREVIVSSREGQLQAREQLLERMKLAQLKLIANWRAQVDDTYNDLEAEGEDLGNHFAQLIALKNSVVEKQARVQRLVREARELVGAAGVNGGEDEGA